MKRVWWQCGCGLAALAVVVGWNLRPAYAVKEFREQFVQKYVQPDAAPDWKTKVNDAKCTVCHLPDQPKEKRNEYGQALAKLVKKSDKKDKAKIVTALEKVAAQKSKTGPAFGELIKQGKLPASGS